MSLRACTTYYCEECAAAVRVVGTTAVCPNSAFHLPGMAVSPPDGTVV